MEAKTKFANAAVKAADHIIHRLPKDYAMALVVLAYTYSSVSIILHFSRAQCEDLIKQAFDEMESRRSAQ